MRPESTARSFILLWLFGICLRLTVLAIPPVIPLLHGSFSLSQAEIGALGSLPVLLLSFAALPGAYLIARFGAVRVLTGGIVLAGLASALRGAAPDTTALFATTFVMGVGIAIMQPALPSIVREWLPARIGLATAVYSNGLLVGEALSASLTIPLVLPMVGNDWRLTMVVWSLPLFVIAMLAMPRAIAGHGGGQAASRDLIWWPDWKSPVTWRIGFIAGGCSSLYFATNTFIPDYLRHLGKAELIGPSLSALNWFQMPASLLLLVFSRQLMLRRWPLVAIGVLASVAMTGLVTSTGGWFVFWAGIVGFCSASLLILTLALPPLLVEAAHVPSVSAAVFAIGYLCAVITPVLGGLAWDVTGAPWTAFVPAGAFGAVIVALSLGLELTAPKDRFAAK
jgi:MFS transporter, CP family, cyanate transporter